MVKIAWLLGATLALSPALVNALVLGRIKVHSALNEPLNAEIEISSVTDKELKGLNVSLAPRAEFDAAGVERLSFLSGIKFAVAKRLDGRYVLQLTTDQQIDEPFLHLLLQVDWPGGRLVREYSALIDPPAQFFAKPSGIQAPAVAPAIRQPEPPVSEPEPSAIAPVPAAPTEELKPEQPATAAVTPAPDAPSPEGAAPTPDAAAPITKLAEPKDDQLAGADDQRLFGPPSFGAPEASPEVEPLAPQERRPDVAPEAAAAPVAKTSAGWTSVGEYTVKRGDTLWEIAEKVRTDKRLATEQVILAIYRANPDAFFGKNVNNLYAGKILKMPERDALESLSAPKARAEFRAQYDVWQEYRLKLAASSTAIKVTAAPAEEQAPAQEPAKPAEKARDAAGQSAKQPDELLKIVRANLQGEKGTPEKKVAETEATKDAKERQALADRVSALEESLLSRQLETKDLTDKIGAVRSQLKREARLIEIDSQQLAQAKAPAPEAAAKPESAKPSEPPKAEVVKPEPPKAEAPKKPEPVAAAPATVEKKPRRVTASPPPPPAPEKGFIDDILESDLLPMLLGGVVVLSGAIGFLYWRRRRKAIGEFEESILTSDSMSSESPASTMTTADTGEQVASAGDTSFLSDFSQGGVGAVHTDEVDPIAEAEVYLAYGRDETAEEILKDAVVKHPERNELKVKLLEIYNQRNDVKAFETVAEELYAALGGRRDKSWEKVEEMGRKLSPANPMFSGGAPAKRSDAGVGRPTPPGATAPLAGGDAATMVFTPDVAPPAGEPVNMTQDSGGLDFDFGAPEPEKPASSGIDFDLGGFGSAAPQDESGEAPIRSVAEQLGLEESSDSGGLASIDFGASSDQGQASGGGIDFDLGAPAEELSAAPADDGGVAAPSGGIDFDVDLGAGGAAASEAQAAEGASGQWDETATKLDLARAYIDMGDAEGARSILDEVMSEGNADQKRQAKELSAQLGA